MFKLIGTISDCLTTTVNDLTQALAPVTASAKHAANALLYHAQELEADAQFEAEKNAATRTTAMAKFNAELAALPAPPA